MVNLSGINYLPQWVIMWSLAVIIFGLCKFVTWRTQAHRDVPFWRQIAYFSLWPGLDAQAFLTRQPSNTLKPTPREWLYAAAKTALGVLLLFGLIRYLPSDHPYLIGWMGMAGIVMILHFGSFHLISCFWRSRGIKAQPLMNAPFTSVSLGEFWGRRWNTAFRDMTFKLLFRPLTQTLGAKWGLFAGFLFSGLIHDLVISLPSGGGYGGPTAFFIIQALGMLFERSKAGRNMGFGKGRKGWLFTMVVLIIPIPLLFHTHFVEGIVVPFMQAIGAL